MYACGISRSLRTSEVLLTGRLFKSTWTHAGFLSGNYFNSLSSLTHPHLLKCNEFWGACFASTVSGLDFIANEQYSSRLFKIKTYLRRQGRQH